MGVLVPIRHLRGSRGSLMFVLTRRAKPFIYSRCISTANLIRSTIDVLCDFYVCCFYFGICLIALPWEEVLLCTA